MYFKETDSIPLRALKIIGATLLGIAGAVVLAGLFGFGVKYLWNWLMPDIFGLRIINFWEAFGLVVLARFLVGGWRHSPSVHSSPRRHVHEFTHAPRGCRQTGRRQASEQGLSSSDDESN